MRIDIYKKLNSLTAFLLDLVTFLVFRVLELISSELSKTVLGYFFVAQLGRKIAPCQEVIENFRVKNRVKVKVNIPSYKGATLFKFLQLIYLSSS